MYTVYVVVCWGAFAYFILYMYSSSTFKELCHATLDNVITWKDQTGMGKQGNPCWSSGKDFTDNNFSYTVFSYFHAAQNSQIYLSL